MDSINRNQSEENRKDLSGTAAVAEIKAIVKMAPNCFFCTADRSAPSASSRPMNVRRVDDDGTLWFFSAADSEKNAELAENDAVTLYFQGSSHSDFLRLDGTATVLTDRRLIEELWEPMLKVWFTEGVDDPRITVLRVTPETGYYWDTKHGNAVAGIKMMIGAALGKTMDDSIEGKLVV